MARVQAVVAQQAAAEVLALLETLRSLLTTTAQETKLFERSQAVRAAAARTPRAVRLVLEPQRKAVETELSEYLQAHQRNLLPR